MRYEEWDWPPRRRQYRRARFRAVAITLLPSSSGWSSPGVRKAVDIYWRITIGIIKALLAVVLSVVAISAFWLLWTIICIARS
jgi:hypothetical protein